jgi:Xaa-Pro aminopeptidase
MTPETFAERRERLRPLLRERNLDALLVSHAANRYYLSGFELHDPQCNESAGLLLVRAKGRDVLLTDPRYRDAALRLWPEEDLFVYSGRQLEMIRAFLKDAVSGSVGVESRALSVHVFQELSRELSLEPVHGLVERLRLRKDAEELARMERSCALNHRVMAMLPELLQTGRSEAAVAWEIEKAFREGGAQGMAFETIVGVGTNAALPHAVPGPRPVPEQGLVLVDTGCRLEDYCSDQTRTVWVGGEPPRRFRETLEQVQEAQQAAIDAIRPGLECAEAYAVARKTLEARGVAQHFTHGLGHGIGLETHEGPSLSPTATGRLEPGMVVTVEPGLYYPDWGGIRWEYMVVVTEDGCTVL